MPCRPVRHQRPTEPASAVLCAAEPLDEDANICSAQMRECGFTITEHDPDRPWMVFSSEHRTIKLPDGTDFFTWAREQSPAPRCSVQVDPWELSPR
jgi:hypothetical protein